MQLAHEIVGDGPVAIVVHGITESRETWRPLIDPLSRHYTVIAVDLRGNVMTCQNTGAKGAHKIGHVADFDAIALDTATHFAFRPECMACPVVQLCKGSCMFLEGDFFAQSCANEFAFNMGIMMAAIWHLTGMVVVGAEVTG